MLIEIVENLFRNDLSVMDRAIFVQTYRDVWEAKYGKVEAGRPGNRVNLTQLLEHEAENGGFSQHVADRMGVSRETVKRLNRISQNLTPKLREKLRGTDAADNQSLLLNLAKRGPTVPKHTVDRKSVVCLGFFFFFALAPSKVQPSKADKQEMAKIELLAAWKKADAVTRGLFVMDRLIEAGAGIELARQAKVVFEARP